MVAAPDTSTGRYRRVIPPGRSWSGLVRHGETLRIVDLVGKQAVDMAEDALAHIAGGQPINDLVAEKQQDEAEDGE